MAPSTVLIVPSPLCSFHQSTLVAPFSSHVRYMSAANRAPGWVSMSIVELVSVTRTGTLAALLIPAYWVISLCSVVTMPAMSAGSVSMPAVVEPPG